MSHPLSFATRRIGVQLAAALILASVAPLAGAGFLVSRLIERTLERDARATHETLLGAARSLVDGHVDGAQAKLQTISRIIVSEDFARPRAEIKADASNREDLARRLNDMLAPSDTFLELAYYTYVGPQGDAPGSNDDPNVWAHRAQAMQQDYGSNVQQKRNQTANYLNDRNGNPIPASIDSPPIPITDPLVREPRSGKPYVSSTIQYAGDIPFIQMSVPVGGPQAIGALVASVNLQPVRGMLGSLAGGKANISLRDAAGAEVAGAPAVSAADAFETRSGKGARGWELAIRQPRSEAFATLGAARRQALGWFGAATLLALLLTAVFTARILPPVRALTAAAERMGRGDLAARTGVRRGDELGELAAAFDRMAEELEKLDQMKSDFVSHVSHELRTPLTAIKLSVANLQDGVVGPLDGRQLEVLSRVRGDLDRLIRMVNEILDAARLEAGKVELAREACDLGAVALGAAESARPLADARGVRLSVEAGEAPVSGDRAKLHEVVLNLVDNAVKFTPSGGEVSVAVASRDGFAELVVTDGGPGIEDGKHSKIFEKFAMIPSNGAPKPPGAGLGLSIAKGLVELHRGTIRAENGAGRGARFVVRLPAAEACRS